MPRFTEPVVLSGTHAVLEPMARAHAAGLRAACADGELWTLWYTSVPRPEAVDAYVDTALALRDEGKALPVRRARARERRHRRQHALHERRGRRTGGWRSAPRGTRERVQRTAINTECKRLLLAHAFETLDCIAVEFRTSWFNHASQRAIERLGAKRDGVLRNHMILPDGTLRDTVVYSILATEWPAVRRHLAHLLERPR